ncbi:FAD binding domain-containing protein [Spirochaeta thermophila]|uniref:Putative xanthine dehydrogenase subunit, FAD-binding domain protein n=1 Tax=Winmispira thermophila (strain ATCC 49972 / DSM 6192 / RI 19.B1) TaxID=665571 RepID=E0RRX2_WINT6|nr:FAD binding domain-containing protein [Spirochaeta thermophila]ADN01759.1 putative xanthine dehydrogenase subunit, FAD-binding domain protein [Spirochaeta thermophila DSM 6192]
MDTTRHSGVAIYYPQDLQDALLLARKRPEAVLMAGGTYLAMSGTWTRFQGPIITLQRVSELSRIIRTERYLEIGAMVSQGHLSTVARAVLPPLLTRALLLAAPPTVRWNATMGGNLTIPDRSLGISPALILLDAVVEIRTSTRSRWIPVSAIRNQQGFSLLHEDEILTRIRIPRVPWTHTHLFSATPPHRMDRPLTLYGLARSEGSLLEEIRWAFHTRHPLPIRMADLEGLLSGQRLPLPEREMTRTLDEAEALIAQEQYGLSPHEQRQALHLLHTFLLNVSYA